MRTPDLLSKAQTALQNQQPKAAEAALRQWLQTRPQDADAMRLLGVALHQQGRQQEAATMLKQVVQALPAFALAHMNLGSVQRAMGETAQAIESFQQACQLEPQRAAGWFNLAKALKHQGRIAEATDAIEKAIGCDQEHMGSQVVRGDLAKANGDIELAARSFRAAIALRPSAGAAWWGLANLKTIRLSSDDVALMQTTLADLPDARIEDKVQIELALARALEHAGLYHDAMMALHRGNGLRRSQLPWDRRAFSALVDQVMATFGTFVSESTLGEPCIFVVSLPRSGSTLVEQILATHSNVTGASELPDFPRLVNQISRNTGVAFPQWVGGHAHADWQELGQRYLLQTQRWRQDRPISTDKLPDNFLYVGAILRALPAARVVFCDRDPRDVMLSCYQQYFAKGQAFSYDLEDILAYWRDYQRLLAHWESLFPQQCLRIQYETLVRSPDTEIPRLLAHCRLPFESACLTPHNAERSVRTASAAQVRQPMDQRGIGRWQPYASWLPAID